MPVFKLAMHPASEGDALILSWGEPEALHHALIDLGRTNDYKALKPRLAEIGRFELFTITHIDADHIEGAVPLFKNSAFPFTARETWFNAHLQHKQANDRLPTSGRVPMGGAQAEKVSVGLAAAGWPWNTRFTSRIISIDSPEASEPIGFEGGLTLRLLSPSDRKLARLLSVWDAELARSGLQTTDPDIIMQAQAGGRVPMGALDVEALAAQPFGEDGAAPNGGSITFIAEFAGKRVLLGADSHPGLVVESLRKLRACETNPYRLDCLKVAHHGSKANTSPELLKIIDCTCFAFSTDGSRHGHPDRQMIARILKNDPKRHKRLIFNFRQPSTEIWDAPALKKAWNYECIFPDQGREGISFDI